MDIISAPDPERLMVLVFGFRFKWKMFHMQISPTTAFAGSLLCRFDLLIWGIIIFPDTNGSTIYLYWDRFRSPIVYYEKVYSRDSLGGGSRNRILVWWRKGGRIQAGGWKAECTRFRCPVHKFLSSLSSKNGFYRTDWVNPFESLPSNPFFSPFPLVQLFVDLVRDLMVAQSSSNPSAQLRLIDLPYVLEKL